MSSRFLYTLSSEMQSVAVAWQIYDVTHRPLDLGLVGLAQFLPGILLFLVAGHTADRVPRRRILIVCCGGFALCSIGLLALTWRGLTSVYPMYAVLLINGVVRVFNGPAASALLPSLVAEEHFQNAVTWGSSIFQGAMVLGPVIGGVVYAIFGSPVPVFCSAVVAYLTAMVLVTRIDMRKSHVPPQKPRAATLGFVLDGFRFIWSNQLILGAISLDLFAVLLGGAVALLPAYARDVLHIGASGLGILRAAPGTGAVLMAIVLAHRPLRRRAGATMLFCVFGFGVFTILFGLSRTVAEALAALLFVGACDMVSVVLRQTLIQIGTPDEMRGRVSAVGGVFIGASNEVGQFESGVTAQWLGAAPAVIAGGVGAIVVVLIWAWKFPALRRYHGRV